MGRVKKVVRDCITSDRSAWGGVIDDQLFDPLGGYIDSCNYTLSILHLLNLAFFSCLSHGPYGRSDTNTGGLYVVEQAWISRVCS